MGRNFIPGEDQDYCNESRNDLHVYTNILKSLKGC